MTEPHVIFALRDKRAYLAGHIKTLEAEIAQARVDLIHVDATLKLFDPAIEPEGIPSKRKAPSRYFAFGELARVCLEAMREERRPVTTAQLGARFMASRGLNGQDKTLFPNFQKTALGILSRLAQRGVVKRTDEGRETFWTLVD
jgi:hypothetical protein